MTVGRPTDYTPELIQKAWGYVNQEHATIPSVAGLCVEINIARSTAYAWAEEEDKEFSDILEALLRKQEEALVSKGLSGDFNSTITKLILTKHGYSDKQETQLSGDPKKPIVTKVVQEIVDPANESPT